MLGTFRHLRGACVLCAATILCGAVSGAALSAPGPNGTRDFNPNAAGPLVEYLIHSDGTGRIEINGPGPISGFQSFESLSRSRDGFRFRLGPGLYVGTTETLGMPLRQLSVPGLVDELAFG